MYIYVHIVYMGLCAHKKYSLTLLISALLRCNLFNDNDNIPASN